MTGSIRRAVSVVLPAFAIAWLAAIYASPIFGDTYVPDLTFSKLYYFDEYLPGSAFAARNQHYIVTQAGPDAIRQGVRPGMELDPNGLSYSQFLHIFQAARHNSIVVVPLRDGVERRRYALPADRPRDIPNLLEKIVEIVTMTFCLVLSAFLGYRKPGIMSAALILFFGAGGFNWPSILPMLGNIPDALMLIIVWPLSVLCDVFPLLLLASVAIRVPGDLPTPPKRKAIRAIDVAVLIGFALECLPQQSQPIRFVYIGLSMLCVLLASYLSLRYARPEDRARVGIVFAGIVIAGAGYAVAMLLLTIGGRLPRFFFDIVNVSLCLIPLSMTYAIVRHRVFDVVFVLNRTLVYGITSALLLLTFAAFEFGTERYLTQLTHAESVVVQFAIALIVVVCAGTVHRRVDRLVDGVLFRSRHEQESALLRFATTAQFYTAEGPLIRDTIEAMVRYACVREVAMYLVRDGRIESIATTFSKTRPVLDENDPSLVEMRAHREPLDIEGKVTEVPGVRAYPLVLAGRLFAVLATGGRDGGERIPPDIDGAIQRICASVASALAAIETDRIRREYSALARRLAELQATPTL